MKIYLINETDYDSHRTILITRDKEKASSLAKMIQALLNIDHRLFELDDKIREQKMRKLGLGEDHTYEEYSKIVDEYEKLSISNSCYEMRKIVDEMLEKYNGYSGFRWCDVEERELK